ncbi:MAG: lasso peptide biosynthesis protein [Anaerobacillus sp.]|uniref:lasso peptide biosynthesis protein n=1 Tax=Anaerobacillus sp. TaxID=1872506 RepID=UPI0039195C5E
MAITMKDRLGSRSFGHVATLAKLSISDIDIDIEKSRELKNTFNIILDHFSNKPMRGGCHFYSAAMYILLEEQDINSQLVIGMVKDEAFPVSFSHSWLEIDGEVFDIAIMFPHYMDGQPPVFASVDLDTSEKTLRRYGLGKNLRKDDKSGLNALNLSISDYLDGYPQGKDFLWREILRMGKRIFKGKTIQDLREKYNDKSRVLK